MLKKFSPYFPLLRPVKWRFLLAVFAGIVAGAAGGFGLPFMTDKVFPLIFMSEETGERAEPEGWLVDFLEWFGLSGLTPEQFALVACLFLPGVFLVRNVASYTNVYLTNYVGMYVLEALRLRAFRRLQELPLKFHQQQREGDLLARLMNDTMQMQVVLVRVAADLVIQPATFLAAITAMLVISIKQDGIGIVWLGIASIPVCVLPIRALGKSLARRARMMQAKAGDMTGTAAENLASQPEIRAYNLEDKQVALFHEESLLLRKFHMKTVKYKSLVGPAVELIAVVGISFSIYQGAKQGIGLESFMGLIVAMYMAYEPVKKLGAINSALRQGEASLERLEYIMNANDEMPEAKNPVKIGRLSGAVSYKNVNFSYEDEPVLSNVSVEVKAGEMVALVGPSGAGKSTFVSLLPRFYEVDSGAVEVDGHDIRNLAKSDLRNQIALVSQHPLLFKGSISDNIKVGKWNASSQEVIAAAEAANAREFIEQMPAGFETQIGERGDGLSGGQRQRIAIARAFLKNAPILIFDEATSALDNESESKVRQSLMRLAAGRTTFIIAHRMSSIQGVGRILVFKDGAIVADGSRTQLLQSSALFRALQASEGDR